MREPAMTPEAAWRALADWVAGPIDLSDRALESAEDAVIDTLACLLAGLAEPSARAAFAVAGGTGAATLAGGGRASAEMAAFAHATAAHALDFDDYEAPGFSHPSTVLVPAILAVGEAEGATGRDALTAYAAGLEVIMATGRVVNPGMYAQGYHTTGYLGALGATAASARLMGLDGAETLNALSLAAGAAAGLKAQFGSGAKALNAGFAARNGVAAATLARHGATGAMRAICGREGFTGLFGGPDAADRAPDVPGGGRPLGIERPGLIQKPWPCCGYLMRLLAEVAALRLEPATVERIRIEAPARNAGVIRFALPETPDEARFSAPYTVAAMIVGGALTPADFTPAAIRRPAVRALAAQLTLTPSEAPQGPGDLAPEDPDILRVTLRSGEAIERVCNRLPGTIEAPLGRDALFRKLRASAAGVLDRDDCDPARPGTLAAALAGLRDLPELRPVLGALRKAGRT